MSHGGLHVTIPVVVHVLHQGEAIGSGLNISMPQIQSQIDVLNEDFRRLNADASNTPGTFTGVVADVGIEFVLACVDPDGYPSDGIIRQQTPFSSFVRIPYIDGTTNEGATGIKFAPTGSDAWPSDRYLNIWVCNLANNLLGYAQFPDKLDTSPATDGVVITTTAFGRTGNVTAPFNKGRTTTHEVGHWLNLIHIWGDDICGDDLVADTPTQGAPRYHCPSHPQTSCNSNDMFMNYMDYTNDACMNLFTQGQADRMLALFSPGGARRSFVDCSTLLLACHNHPGGIHVSGSSTICTEETYTLSGVPSGHTITWTKSSNLTYISGQNTANYTVKATPNTAGSMWVEAAVSGPCGVMTFRKNLFIVVPEIDVTFYGETNVCPNEFYWYDVITPGSFPILNYIWSLPTGWTLVDEQIINSNFRSIEVRTGSQSYGNYAIWVDIQTDCNNRSYSYPVQMMSCASSYDFTVHPNPASDYFEVSRSLSEDNINSAAKERGTFLESQGEKGSAAVAVKLYNSKQEAVISMPFASPALRVDTKGLPDGHYILHIISKEGIHRRHLYIEKNHTHFSQ